ncbi:FliI/YscN family ATPase [bacterium]|nr:FliI/YscN family ATPase [bacterium]
MSGFNFDFSRKLKGLDYLNLFQESGRVKKVLGPIVEGSLPNASIGSICALVQRNKTEIEAEIVGFRDNTALLMPLDETAGLAMGTRIEQRSESAKVSIGPAMIGRLINGKGEIIPCGVEVEDTLTIDARPEIREIKAPALKPQERASISEKLETGVRTIDSTIPFAKGQRLSVMAASGVGKSVLMGMIAKRSKASLNVIALIGERGREVNEFLERDLGPEGMKNTIVVAVTSDESPVLKVRGAYLATTIAEYFRDQGMDVLLMMDSVTRFAMALREIGLASGEPPTSKGYTPSVFGHLPKLLERAGARRSGGSITGLYTVLVEGNDIDDPIADSVRSIVDGHIVLSRDLAHKNHFPAIDVLGSISRLNQVVLSDREKQLDSAVRKVLSVYKDAEDLINIGGYRKGNNPDWDDAIEKYPKLLNFLKQPLEGEVDMDRNAMLEDIFRG